MRRENKHYRRLYAALAWVCLILACVGVVLPLLPTTPFLLCSLWFSVRARSRLAQWLQDHPRFGPPLERWQRERSISRGTKGLVSAMLLYSWIILWLSGSSGWVLFAAGCTFCGIALFIILRIPTSQPEPGAVRGSGHIRSSDQV